MSKKTKEETTPVEVVPITKEPQPTSIVKVDLEPMTIDPQALRERMALETERRKVLTDYISANMKEGTDYGKIAFKDKITGAIRGESKPTLFKPGAEKFCSLFSLQATFNKDFETWEMLGSQQGVIAYVCVLKTKSGTIVGEGRGIADIREKQGWTANNCVKIAEKRAQIDAVLRSGGLSDFFTQDLEDKPDDNYDVGSRSFRNASPDKISQPQMRMIFGLIKKANSTKEQFESWLVKSHNVIGIENLPKQLASQIIEGLVKKYGYPETKAPVDPQEDVPTITLDDEQKKGADEQFSGDGIL